MADDQRTTTRKISLEEALEAFLLDCRARRLAPSTVEIYEEKLRRFFKWAEKEGLTMLADVDAHRLRRFLLWLDEVGHNAGGQHIHARALRAWLNFLEADGILEVSPMRRVRMPKLPKPLPRVLTEGDIDAMLAAAGNDRDKAIILALLDTGARVSEFVALNVGDVDTAGAVKIHHGKGDKARTVFLGYRALRALRRYLWQREDATAPASPLWASFRNPETGERMTTNAVRQMLKRVAARADVAKANPHAFRATFALWSLRSGMDIYTLARLMGHADIAVLKHYLALAETDLAEAHRQHGPVDSYLKRKRP